MKYEGMQVGGPRTADAIMPQSHSTPTKNKARFPFIPILEIIRSGVASDPGSGNDSSYLSNAGQDSIA